jgi:hypothetical protein
MVNILTPALSASGCAGCDPPLLGLFCESIQPVQTTCQKYKLATYDRKKHRTTSEKQPPPLNSRAEFAAGFDLTTSHRVRRAQSQIRRAAEPFLRPKPGSVHRCLQSCRQIRSWGALRKMEKAKRSARSGKKKVPSSSHSLPNRNFWEDTSGSPKIRTPKPQIRRPIFQDSRLARHKALLKLWHRPTPTTG